MWAWRAELAPAGTKNGDLDRGVHGLGGQREADLAAAGKLDVDLREQLGIEQRAVQHAVAAIDPVARAQRVERMLGPRVPPPRERQRVDHPLERYGGLSARAELVIEEAEIELRIVRNERRFAEKLQQVVDVVGKALLVGEEGVAEPMDLLGGKRHRTLGIEVGVESASRR